MPGLLMNNCNGGIPREFPGALMSLQIALCESSLRQFLNRTFSRHAFVYSVYVLYDTEVKCFIPKEVNKSILSDWWLNKPGYTATEVPCGWVGAIFEVTKPFGQERWGPNIKIIKKSVTNRLTDWPTKRGVELRSTRQKTMKFSSRTYIYDFLLLI